MSKSDKYVQFPLCALAFGGSERERLNIILDSAVLYAGTRLWTQLAADQKISFLNSLDALSNIPEGFDRNDPVHCAALYGALTIGVEYDRIDRILSSGPLFRHFADFRDRHGGDPIIRIKKSWFFKVRDRKGLSYREFAILCAVNSCIGDKEFAHISLSRIRHRALGYKTDAVMEAELSNRKDSAEPLSVRQVGTTIKRLHRNKFFARCTALRCKTYYSIRLDEEGLRRRVRERHTYAAFHHAIQSAQDEALNAAIKSDKAKAKKECGSL